MGKITNYDEKIKQHKFVVNDEFRQFLAEKKEIEIENSKQVIEIDDKTIKIDWKMDPFLMASGIVPKLIINFLPKQGGYLTISNQKEIVYDMRRKAFHVKGINKIFPLDSISFCEYDCSAFLHQGQYESTMFSNLKATFYIGEIFYENDKVCSKVDKEILSNSSFTTANPKSTSPVARQYATVAYFLKPDGTRNRKLSSIQQNMINFQVELLRYHPYQISVSPQKKDKDSHYKVFIRAQVELVTFKEKM